MLIVFGGLPGTGKTTVARDVATHLSAFMLRIDIIEQAIRAAGVPGENVGAAGYEVAGALARANLDGGVTVVIDAVNPVAESRAAWRLIAADTRMHLVEIELVCSDPHVHRARLEGRTPDIAGMAPVTWQDVLTRHYEIWREPHAIIDTAAITASEATAAAMQVIQAEQPIP